MGRRRGEDWKMPPRLNVVTYLTVKDMTGQTLKWSELPAATDLHAALNAAANELRREGWQAEPIGSRRWEFFATRNGVRVSVGVQRAQPGAAFPSSWPTSDH
jgi:hypothetical protein